MRIEETTPKQFDALFAANNPCFNTAEFAALNASRCEEYRCLLFIDSKVRLGLIAARKEAAWISPFSAPFGGFVTAQHAPTVLQAEESVNCLKNWLTQQKAGSFRITMPPLFYQPSLITKMHSACLNNGFTITDYDLNFHIKCGDFSSGLLQKRMSRNAHRNLKTALDSKLEFQKTTGEDGLREAYDVIRINREEKGYHLSMDEKNVLATAACLRADSFVLYDRKQPVASAIVFHVAPGIVQVIYWGDRMEGAAARPMFLLAHKIFEYYSNTSIQIIDVGPAMIDNRANYGLCDFKEAVGCEINPKLTLLWENQ